MLIELPAELRKEIFKLVVGLDDGDVRIKNKFRKLYSNQRLIAPSGLILVSRQINSEYYTAFVDHAFEAARLTVSVIDFDFCHLTSLFSCPNTCTSKRHQSFNNRKPKAKLDINMQIVNPDSINGTKGLGYWCALRKTLDVDVNYTFVGALPTILGDLERTLIDLSYGFAGMQTDMEKVIWAFQTWKVLASDAARPQVARNGIVA